MPTMKNQLNKEVAPNCYCGNSVNIGEKYLVCVKCKKRYHEACIKSLKYPMLFGDSYFIYMCSKCNIDSEYLHRIELKWLDIAQLLLYHLSVSRRKKYFHLDDVLIPFLEENWKRFYITGDAESNKKDAHVHLSQILMNKKVFKCGKEIKKSKFIFGLRIRIPPKPSLIEYKKIAVYLNIKISALQNSSRNSYGIANKKNGSKYMKKKMERKRKCCFDINNNTIKNCVSGSNKIKALKKRKCKIDPFSDYYPVNRLLDTLIPRRPNFLGRNNPFSSSFKSLSVQSATTKVNKVPVSGKKRQYNEENSVLYDYIRLFQESEFKSNENGPSSFLHWSKPVDIPNVRHPRKCKALPKVQLYPQIPEGVYIMGKRISCDRKVQYLVAKDETK